MQGGGCFPCATTGATVGFVRVVGVPVVWSVGIRVTVGQAVGVRVTGATVGVLVEVGLVAFCNEKDPQAVKKTANMLKKKASKNIFFGFHDFPSYFASP